MHRSRTTTAVPRPVDARSGVTVLAGFSSPAVEAVARVLLVARPDLAVVRHDISAIRAGRVRRTVHTGRTVLEDETIELAHGCVSCTLREDVLPTLVGLARRRPGAGIVLALPPVIEPEAVAAACTGCAVDGTALTDVVRFDSFVTVVEADAIVSDLTSSDDLRHRNLHAAHNDHRSVAGVAMSQIEYADTLVTWGAPDPWLRALLSHLAPWAVQVGVGGSPLVDCTGLADRLLDTARHRPGTPAMVTRALEGFPIGVETTIDDHGVGTVLFRARRPMHPQRLHDALGDLAGEALRGRGHLWIASQPDTVLGWESAGGGVGLCSLGHWLAALPVDRWTQATDHRRLAADATWDPYYGDRHTTLAFVGIHLDTDTLTHLLTACLLTDAELADGADAWRHLPDPFVDCFPLFEENRP
jgi:G3E family GTPase